MICLAQEEIKPLKIVRSENIAFFVFNMLNINLSQYYYSKPFVFIFSCFAGGVLLGSVIGSSDQYLAAISFASIGFLLLAINGIIRGRVFMLLSGLILFVLGIFHQQMNSGLRQSNDLVSSHREDDSYIMKVSEFSVSASGWNKCVLDAEQRIRNGKPENISGKVLAYVQTGDLTLQQGDKILCPTEINRIRNNGNPGEFDAEKYWSSKGISGMMFVGEEDFKLVDHTAPDVFSSTVVKVRKYLSETVDDNFVGEQRAVVKAIVLGDKSLLDSEIRDTFGNTGAMHVLAVSGLHVGILLLLLMFCFERISSFISRRTALVSVLLILWFYAFLTGLSPSVIRAVFMFSILVASQVFYKKYSPINVLFFTAFVLILVNPNYVMDIGFQLSYLAMLGIFVFYGPIEKLLKVENFILKKAWQGTAVGLAAQLMTLPLILSYFHQFPNYFALSNLGLMLFSGLILGLGVAVFALSFSSFLIKPVVMLLSFILFLTIGYLQWIEGLPGAVARGYDVNITQLLLLFILPFLLFSSTRKRVLFSVMGLTVLLAIWISVDRYERMNNNELIIYNSRATVFSLKQGDKIVCGYEASRIDKEKVQRMIADYTKLYPGNVRYILLENKKVRVSGKHANIEVVPSKDHYKITVGDEKIDLIRSLFYSYHDGKSKRVAMPWLRTGADHYLNKGAFRMIIPV